MMHRDFEGVDQVDRPIPFHLTAKGTAALREAEAEELLSFCEHTWTRQADAMVCTRCGLDRPLQNGPSIPSYLGPKGRYERR